MTDTPQWPGHSSGPFPHGAAGPQPPYGPQSSQAFPAPGGFQGGVAESPPGRVDSPLSRSCSSRPRPPTSRQGRRRRTRQVRPTRPLPTAGPPRAGGAPHPHRDPGPRRVDHLHHHTPATLSDHPTTRAANQLVARLNIEHQSIWGASHAHQMEALQTDEQITPITTIKRHGAAAGRVRHRPRSLTTARVQVRSSSRTSTPTRNPRPTPTHPHSTRKSL